MVSFGTEIWSSKWVVEGWNLIYLPIISNYRIHSMLHKLKNWGVLLICMVYVSKYHTWVVWHGVDIEQLWIDSLTVIPCWRLKSCKPNDLCWTRINCDAKGWKQPQKNRMGMPQISHKQAQLTKPREILKICPYLKDRYILNGLGLGDFRRRYWYKIRWDAGEEGFEWYVSWFEI